MAQERLGPGRIHHCMRWMGICERAFDMMCLRAATRALAPGVVLGQKQAVQHAIADSRAEIDAARLLILEATRLIDRDGASAAREQISMIKQLHGALGMTDDTPLAYWFRTERAARIYDGADEVHKSFVARRILKRYGVQLTE